MRLEDLAYEFVLRAKEAIMKAGEEEGGEEVLGGAALVHQRVFAYG